MDQCWRQPEIAGEAARNTKGNIVATCALNGNGCAFYEVSNTLVQQALEKKLFVFGCGLALAALHRRVMGGGIKVVSCAVADPIDRAATVIKAAKVFARFVYPRLRLAAPVGGGRRQRLSPVRRWTLLYY